MGSIPVVGAVGGDTATSVRVTDPSRAGLSVPLPCPLIERRLLPQRPLLRPLDGMILKPTYITVKGDIFNHELYPTMTKQQQHI